VEPTADLPPELSAWHQQPAVVVLVDRIGDFFQAFGFKRNVGRLWAVLYLSPRSLDQAELGTILGLSSGLISTGLRELESIEAIQAEVRPGCRRVQYRAEPRLLRVVATILTRRDLAAVLELRATVRAARDALPPTATWARERLALMDDVTRLYERMAGLVVRLSRANLPALGLLARSLRGTPAGPPGNPLP
jgi:DNA-binding transcriptional regulator GbsR (MarR family)